MKQISISLIQIQASKGLQPILPTIFCYYTGFIKDSYKAWRKTHPPAKQAGNASFAFAT
ncbi:MAG: hypothetical protein IPH58_10885 [Sphingobacteriales bacterium]|nr:hypothetical protein [Sphingobacteriales bacterium]